MNPRNTTPNPFTKTLLLLSISGLQIFSFFRLIRKWSMGYKEDHIKTGCRVSGVGCRGQGETVRSNLVWSSRLEGNDRDKGKE
jgi:hypothetical protein